MSNVLRNETSNLPKITIVTVVINLIQNNRKEAFKQCIDSIRQQTYPNIEHIVIDGASTDGTIELLQEMKLNFISEKDSGIYDAMNKGIKLATGKYIAFMNSDDYYAAPNVIEEVMNKFKETNADAVYGKALILGKKNLYNTYNIGTCFYHMPVCHQAFFCTVDALKEIGMFDTTFRIAGDYNSMYQMVLKQKIFVPIDLLCACFNMGGISDKYNELSRNETLRVVQENVARFDKTFTLKDATKAYNRKFVPFAIYQKMRQSLHPKMVKTFDRIFVKAVFKELLHSMIIIRLNKRAPCIHLFGITFYGNRYK